MITREDTFKYNLREIVEAYKEYTETTATGDELLAEMWDNLDILGEVFFNRMTEYTDISEVE